MLHVVLVPPHVSLGHLLVGMQTLRCQRLTCVRAAQIEAQDPNAHHFDTPRPLALRMYPLHCTVLP